MKKSLFLLAILATFAFGAVAQDTTQPSSATGQTSTAKSKKKSSDSDMSKGEHSGMAMDEKGKSSGKGSTLTGCVSSSADTNGMYTLSNGKFKKGVEIGPADKVKEHAGHQVSLTGKWSTAAAAGNAIAASPNEKGERLFEVDNVKHISETCSAAPGGGTTGSKTKKGDKKSTSAAMPPQTK